MNPLDAITEIERQNPDAPFSCLWCKDEMPVKFRIHHEAVCGAVKRAAQNLVRELTYALFGVEDDGEG